MPPTGRDTGPASGWPTTPDSLIRVQEALAVRAWTPWRPLGRSLVGASSASFAQVQAGPGRAEDVGWAAAALGDDVQVASAIVHEGYEPGLLALREGPLREAAVRMLAEPPEVLLVDATGRDHPRRAGLALQLGAVLGLPTVGITDRPLLARGDEPGDERGAVSALMLDGERVGYLLRTRPGARPVCVHAAWRTMPETAVEVVLSATEGMRTPEPLRRARSAARRARGRERRA